MISWLFQAAARIRSLFTGSRMDRDLDQELDTHIAMLTEEGVQRGLPADVALREAQIRVGSRGALHEIHRDARSPRIINDFFRDVHHSVRLFRRTPLFTLVAVVSLAIGIGADATVFTAANALLFRLPDSVREPAGLVDISRTMRGRFGVFQVSYPDVQDLRRRTTTLDDIYMYEPMTRPMSMIGPDGAEPVFGLTVSLNYFQALGVASTAGQLFPPDRGEDSRNNPFVVLSYAFWHRRFKDDLGVIGKTVRINGEPVQVIGVAGNGFQGTTIVAPDIWLPMGSTPNDLMRFTRRDIDWGLVGGRLKRGVTAKQASSELSAIADALTAEYPNEHRGLGLGLKVAPLSMIPGNLVLAVAGIFTVLMVFVSLVLLIACANMASVLLSRAAMRRGELAVRFAIGAGRARLMRQLMTETVLIFLLGGGAGLLLSRVLTRVVIAQIPDSGVPVNLVVALDARILVFTFGLSLVAALMSGLVPALHASKADVVSTLKNEGQSLTQRSRLQNVFVVGQVAFSILLVVAAALFLGALQRSSSLPLGYDPHNVELVTIDLLNSGRTTGSGAVLLRELVERIRALPGVQESTVSTFTPLDSGMLVMELRAADNARSTTRPAVPSVPVSWNSVEPGYFATMKIPLLAGRDFSTGDGNDSQPVAIVSEQAARQFWPGHDPIGRYLPASLGDPGNEALVVGVARNLMVVSGPSGSLPVVYRPLMQRYFPRVTIAVRSVAGRRFSKEIRALISSMNPDISILQSQTLEAAISTAMAPQRNAAAVTGSLGFIGLLLASLGVYGVTAYAVARRTREIGVRIALGATPGQVTQLVLREGMTLVGIGLIIGLVLAYAASRALRASPLDVPPANVSTFVAAAVLFLALGLIACWTPVRRATRIDAMSALRRD